MGAELSSCGCGVEMRSEGKLDAGWTAPAALRRLPGDKSVTLDEEKKAQVKMPGTPPTPPSRETKENAVNGEMKSPSARTLAARLLADAKNGRTANIKTMFDGQMPALEKDQVRALLSATEQSVGNTPLMLSAKNGHHECVEYLAKRGSDVHAHNRKDQTAIDLAASAGHAKVVALLKTHGAIDFPVI